MDGMTQDRPISGFLRDVVKVSCKEPTEVVLGGGAVQCCTVEFPCCSCPWATGLDYHAELGSDHAMISPTLCSTHDSGGENIPPVCLTDNYIVQEVPVL